MNKLRKNADHKEGTKNGEDIFSFSRLSTAQKKELELVYGKEITSRKYFEAHRNNFHLRFYTNNYNYPAKYSELRQFIEKYPVVREQILRSQILIRSAHTIFQAALNRKPLDLNDFINEALTIYKKQSASEKLTYKLPEGVTAPKIVAALHDSLQAQGIVVSEDNIIDDDTILRSYEKIIEIYKDMILPFLKIKNNAKEHISLLYETYLHLLYARKDESHSDDISQEIHNRYFR